MHRVLSCLIVGKFFEYEEDELQVFSMKFTPETDGDALSAASGGSAAAIDFFFVKLN